MAKSGKKKSNKKKKSNSQVGDIFYEKYTSGTQHEKITFLRNISEDIVLTWLREQSDMQLEENIVTRTSLLYTGTYFYEQQQQHNPGFFTDEKSENTDPYRVVFSNFYDISNADALFELSAKIIYDENENSAFSKTLIENLIEALGKERIDVFQVTFENNRLSISRRFTERAFFNELENMAKYFKLIFSIALDVCWHLHTPILDTVVSFFEKEEHLAYQDAYREIANTNETARQALARYFHRDFFGQVIMPTENSETKSTLVGMRVKNTYRLHIPGTPSESIHFFSVLNLDNSLLWNNAKEADADTGTASEKTVPEPRKIYAISASFAFSKEQNSIALLLIEHFNDLLERNEFPLRVEDSEELTCEEGENLVALTLEYHEPKTTDEICRIAHFLMQEMEASLSHIYMQQKIMNKAFSSLRRLKTFSDCTAEATAPKDAAVSDIAEVCDVAADNNIATVHDVLESSEEDETIVEGETIKDDSDISNDEIYEQVLKEYEVNLDSKEQRIRRQESEILQLKAKVAALESTYVAAEAESERTIRLKSNEKELFPYEVRDLILRLAKEELVRIEGDKILKQSRRADLLRDIVSENEGSHTLDDTIMELKNLLTEGKEGKMTDGQKHQMSLLGFVPMDNNKEHYKVTFHGDPRYSFVLASTESDARGKRNFISSVRKRLF